MANRKFSIVVRTVVNIWAEVELDTESEEFKEMVAEEGSEEDALKQAMMEAEWDILNEETDDQELVYHEEILNEG